MAKKWVATDGNTTVFFNSHAWFSRVLRHYHVCAFVHMFCKFLHWILLRAIESQHLKSFCWIWHTSIFNAVFSPHLALKHAKHTITFKLVWFSDTFESFGMKKIAIFVMKIRDYNLFRRTSRLFAAKMRLGSCLLLPNRCDWLERVRCVELSVYHATTLCSQSTVHHMHIFDYR